jgi:alkyl hydroperoxide reductase subunit AhpC
LQQIVDLQNDPAFQALNIGFVSIAFDSHSEQLAAVGEYGIRDVPMAIDSEATVSSAYDILQWAVASGEPGHTFILVDQDGIIAWIQDYGAPENRGVMYVEPGELVNEIRAHLSE